MRLVGVALLLMLLSACGTGADSASPIGPRENHVLASIGDSIVIWGGSAIDPDGARTLTNSGAVYEPDSGKWTEITPAPIAGRTQAFSFWDGSELFVLGGFGVTDAAAWDPTSNEWRPLDSEVPVASQGWDTAGAWDGGRFVLWHVPSDRVWAYDPTVDEWESLGATGIPDRNLGGMQATGHGVIAFSNQPPFVAAQLNGARLSPGSMTWQPMPWLSFENESGPGDPTPLATAWSGGQLLAWAASGSDSASFVWDPDLDVWREFEPPALPACEFALRPAVTADVVVARNDCGDAALLDPATLAWSTAEFPNLTDVAMIEHDGQVFGLDRTGELFTWTPPKR